MRPDSFARSNKGFTLIEIMIALFVFTIVSLILVGALHNVLNSESATAKKAQQLSELQIALLLMSQDIEQTINRPITNPAGKREGFIGTQDSIVFTHAGLPNPDGQLRRTTLQRTGYSRKEGMLIRSTWPVLDQTAETAMDSRRLLHSVTNLRFEYLDEKHHFQKSWPPLAQTQAILPLAVRVSLTLKNWGTLNQLYIMTGQPLEIPH